MKTLINTVFATNDITGIVCLKMDTIDIQNTSFINITISNSIDWSEEHSKRLVITPINVDRLLREEVISFDTIGGETVKMSLDTGRKIIAIQFDGESEPPKRIAVKLERDEYKLYTAAMNAVVMFYRMNGGLTEEDKHKRELEFFDKKVENEIERIRKEVEDDKVRFNTMNP